MEKPRKRSASEGLVLDAGAFIALEKRSGHVTKLLAHLVRADVPMVTSGGVIAQIWRGGRGAHAPVAMLLQRVEVAPLDRASGKMIGLLLGVARTSDPVDGHVVLMARERRWPVLTSDAGDLLAIDPSLTIVHV